MFAGIIEEAAEIISFERSTSSCRLIVQSGLDHSHTSVGDSIAISGVCLTVVARDGGKLSFDLAEETLRRTTLGTLGKGSRVNLERSLRVGDRIAGHFVFGHVDSTLTLADRVDELGSTKLTFEFDPSFRAYFATKGSVSISGVSLTVGPVESDRFSVYIIPHTAQVTTLGAMQIGDRANLEVDMLARYVVEATNAMTQNKTEKQPGVSQEFLRQHGFAK